MTTIYIPQRIETAEQAEALPEGSIFWLERSYGFRFHYGTVGKYGVTFDRDGIDEGTTGRALVPTTAVHEIARELSDSNDRGWHASIGDELLEALAGRPHG